MTVQQVLLGLVEIGAFGFTILYSLCNSALILIGFGPSRARVRALAHSDLDLLEHAESCPPIGVLVPAYNEEVAIVDVVRAFLELDYPALEIVVVNDGSTDATLEVLRQAYGLVRRDVTLRHDLGTACVRGVHEATRGIPERVQRLVVVDKENGGRADALNCAVNVCRAPYFITVDGDSMLDPLALKHIMRMIQDDPSIQAAGGQIGIVNEAPVENGRVIRRVVPRSYLPLCQTLEYVRSFTTARSGFTRLDCLMIVSGAFLVMRRDVALSLGGFLTGRVRSRLLDEYAGPGKGTIGEDMEMIVRLHRHERENGRKARVVHSALPVCWTEVPSTWTVLGRQRRRWHRGLLEILRYHRAMLFDPAYGRIGLFSFPFIALFEGLGPYLEAMGYLLLPILLIAGWIEPQRVLLLTGVTLAVGMLHSMIAVLCATWLEPVVPAGSRMRSLLGVERWSDRLLLLAACVLAEIGYRQMTVLWRIQGTWEALRGKGSWGVMERRGFRAPTKDAATVGAFLLGAVVSFGAAAANAQESGIVRFRESTAIFATERGEGREPGAWFESATRWEQRDESRGRASWVGLYGFAREGGKDLGFIAGAGASIPRRAGGSLELRMAPGAVVSARAAALLDGEVALRRPLSAIVFARTSWFRDAWVFEAAPGLVVYLPRDAWLSAKVHWTHSHFDEGLDDDLFGWSGTLSLPVGRVQARLLASSSGESYVSGFSPAPSRLRAHAIGLMGRVPFARVWAVESGITARFPERGEDDFALHAGLRLRW